MSTLPSRLSGIPRPVQPQTFDLVNKMHDEYRRYVKGCPAFDDSQNLGKTWDNRRDGWRCLIAAGHTLDQLRLVLKFLDFQIKKSQWNVACLSLRNITNVDNFREKLGLAGYCKDRMKPRTDKEAVLAKIGRSASPDSSTGQVKTPADVLAKVLPEDFKNGCEEMRKAAGL